MKHYFLHIGFANLRSFGFRIKNAFVLHRTQELLRNAKAEHMLLCRTCEYINKVFSLQILLFISQTFITTLSTLFFWIRRKILDDWRDKSINKQTYYFYSSSLLLLHATQLIILVICCSKTANEVSTCTNILSRVRNSKIVSLNF